MKKMVGLMMILVFGLAGCTQAPAREDTWFESYRDIPGITDEHIAAVAQIRQQYSYFIYAMLQNDEAFYTRDGIIVGFAAQLSGWLTGLFDIPFIPRIYDELPDLLGALADGSAHFSGQMPRLQVLIDNQGFAFTDPISKRSVAIVRNHSSRPLYEIILERDLRFSFADGSALPGVMRGNPAFGDFEHIFAACEIEAAELLRAGLIDAYIGDGELYHSIKFPGFRVAPLYPYIFGYASFATQNPALVPIVEIVQLALENGAMPILANLYAAGKADARLHIINQLLTNEERAFIAANPTIPLAAHGFSYPISFFSQWDQDFRGIAFDILYEIERLTGLHFEIINFDAPFGQSVDALVASGEAFIATGAHRSCGDCAFVLSDSFFADRYALISYGDAPIIGVNELFYMRVAMVAGGVYEEVFRSIFPEHNSIVLFEWKDLALDSIVYGEADLVFSSLRGLFRANHLLERPGFRANLVLDEIYRVSFALNADHYLLASIVNKALSIINTETISTDWMGRTFDFSVRVLMAQRPWLIGSVVLAICLAIVSFILYLLFRRRQIVFNTEARNAAKSRFLARMSHEIRTPITAVLGIAEIHLRNMDLPENLEESFARIHDSAHMLLGLVNDILDFSKIESGKVILTNVEYEVVSLVHDTAQAYMIYLENRNISINFDINENMPARLFGDPLRIRQIIYNLVSNALKYTDAGSVTLALDFENKPGDGIELIITITDTGLGMTPEQLEALKTDEFIRFHEHEERIVGGTGLGVSIVYSLVNMMNGTIRFDSEVGRGTTVRVCIPQETRGADVLGETAKSLKDFDAKSWDSIKMTQFVPEPMPYGRVLLVDDMEANLFVARGLLEFYSLQIDICENAHDAIDKIKSGEVYDIIFMDNLMPGLNGIDAMRIMRDHGYDHPIVVLTANALVGLDEEFIAAGFDDFISKPIPTERLNEILNRYVRDRHPAEVVSAARTNTQPRKGINEYLTSADMANTLRDRFAKSNKTTYRDFAQALANNDLKTAHRLAHTIKSAAALIGANALTAAAQAAENPLRDGHPPTPAQIATL
ncbi:MAG: ATP-binding protein, partial [Defluviitaleaceae bacterium]|nr:ATP-binding protein [Defluviitaleaceae bacterium]